jgi:hypothetical protein
MNATPAPRGLPGYSTASSSRSMSRIYATFALLFTVMAAINGYQPWAARGHLRSPLLQFAFATPIGQLFLVLIGVIALFPMTLIIERIILARDLARAVDVTDAPEWAWPERPPGWAERTRAERWLGRGRHARALNLIILILTALLAVLVVVDVIAQFGYINRPACTAARCPPDYSISHVLLASLWIDLCVMLRARSRRQRSIEAACGIWLRGRSGGGASAPTYYLRQPGVTVEQAEAALARFRPRSELPVAQWCAVAVLAFAWAAALWHIQSVLAAWLPTQWIPG